MDQTLQIKRRPLSFGKVIRKNNFGKLNTKEIFKDLDKNNDNMIEMNEWIEFWQRVKKAGYSEEEIELELKNIDEGNSWAHFNVE